MYGNIVVACKANLWITNLPLNPPMLTSELLFDIQVALLFSSSSWFSSTSYHQLDWLGCSLLMRSNNNRISKTLFPLYLPMKRDNLVKQMILRESYITRQKNLSIVYNSTCILLALKIRFFCGIFVFSMELNMHLHCKFKHFMEEVLGVKHERCLEESFKH